MADLVSEQSINFNYDMNWSHKPSMLKDSPEETDSAKEEAKEGASPPQMFANKSLQEIIQKKNLGVQSILKKVNFQVEQVETEDPLPETAIFKDEVKISIKDSLDVENEVNQKLNKENLGFESNKKGRTFRETMGNIYSHLEKTFDNLSIEESPRESIEEKMRFGKKLKDTLVHSDLNNYILPSNVDKKKLIQTTKTEVIRDSAPSTDEIQKDKIFYNKESYSGKVRMQSPDLIKHLHGSRRSRDFRKAAETRDTQRSFVQVGDEQKTLEKSPKPFSPKRMIQNYSRTPKQFSQTQKIWSKEGGLSSKIKSTRILPNLPFTKEPKLTQSFYEYPVHSNATSMIIDRSHDWGHKQSWTGNFEYDRMSHLQKPKNAGMVFGRSQMGVPGGFLQKGWPGQGANQIGLTDVTRNYSALVGKSAPPDQAFDWKFRNQFIRMESQAQQGINSGYFTDRQADPTRSSINEIETQLALLFKKILVFSSKVDSLQKKIMKRNPDFNCMNIFQTFCDPKSRRLTIDGLKDFFQTFGFDFSEQFLLRVTVFLSSYRLDLSGLGRREGHSNGLDTGRGSPTDLSTHPKPGKIPSEFVNKITLTTNKSVPDLQSQQRHHKIKNDQAPLRQRSNTDRGADGKVEPKSTLSFADFRRLLTSTNSGPIDWEFHVQEDPAEITILETEYHIIRQILMIMNRQLDDMGTCFLTLRKYQNWEVFDVLLQYDNAFSRKDLLNGDTGTEFSGDEQKILFSSSNLRSSATDQQEGILGNELKERGKGKRFSKVKIDTFKGHNCKELEADVIGKFLERSHVQFLPEDISYIFKAFGCPQESLSLSEFESVLNNCIWSI